MKIWMSHNTKTTNPYALRQLGPILGGIFIYIILCIASIPLTNRLGLSWESVSTFLVFTSSAFFIWLAFRIGRTSGRDALIFCQDEAHRLFAVNAMSFVNYRKGALGFISMSSQTQKILEMLRTTHTLERLMSNEQSLTEIAQEILWVEKIITNPKSHSVVCQIQDPTGRRRKGTYIIMPGYDREEELLLALQMKAAARPQLEAKINRNPLWIFLSAVVLTADIVLCYFSHMDIGLLPGAIYYPCLLFAIVPLYTLTYFIIKNVRGE